MQAMPLWHGVELVRGLTTGSLAPIMLVHVLYFVVMILVGVVVTTKRLRAFAVEAHRADKRRDRAQCRDCKCHA